MKIKELVFKQTCPACPEQYDVFDGDKKVGYVRLRWGKLTCEYPDVNGELIYSASIGDGETGMFENEKQRNEHLTAIAEKINDVRGKSLKEAESMTELEVLRKAMQEIFDLAHQDEDAQVKYCKEKGIPEDCYSAYAIGVIASITDAALDEVGIVTERKTFTGR